MGLIVRLGGGKVIVVKNQVRRECYIIGKAFRVGDHWSGWFGLYVFIKGLKEDLSGVEFVEVGFIDVVVVISGRRVEVFRCLLVVGF